MKARAFPILSLLTLLPVSGLAQAVDLLPAEEAFAFTANQESDDTVRATWDIAEGYYMYRDKIEFDLEGSGQISANPTLPDGKAKQDALFGDVEVYVDRLEVALKVSGLGAEGATLVARGQGCNEPVGVCYPPMVRRINLIPAALADEPVEPQLDPAPALDPGVVEAQSSPVAGVGSVDELRQLLTAGFEQPDFLDVDDAFRLEIQPVDGTHLEANFLVADGYYLYRTKTEFKGEGGARVASTAMPDGTVIEDAYFGEMEVYKQSFTVPITLQRDGPGATDIVIKATYQGCAEAGICYPPVNKTFTLALPAIIASAAADTGIGTETGTKSVSSEGSKPKSGTGLLLGAFLAGLLLTFTPCVLPLIPILTSVIAGQGESVTRSRGGILATTYVLGTLVTYAAMGALAGATGEQLQAYFQNAWAIGILAAVLVLMALSLFGLFTVQMPTFIQAGLQDRTRRWGGTLPLVFALGLVSALIVGACVSPVLISFLGIAITRGDPWIGAQIMAAMALGMGVPLIAMGFGAGYLIPRAGPWMRTVNQVFGVMLLGVAIYILGALPEVPVLFLWGALFIVVSVFMGATRSVQADTPGREQLARGLGIILLVWGIVALVGGFLGERSILKPLPSNLLSRAVVNENGATVAHAQSPLTRITSMAELDRELARAQDEGRFVMIDYYADWCVDCIRLEETTFEDNRVREYLANHFVALQVDVTDPHDEEGKALKSRFGVFGPPAVLFIDRNGTPLADRHFYGYRDADDFLALITSL